VARTQTNSPAISTVFITRVAASVGKDDREAVNKDTVNSLIMRILVYSAIKIRANNPLLYSTLNPDTSSDSPSAKSNGVRFVSARLVMNHMIEIGRIIRNTQEY
jgi:hypothetical protein